MTVLKTDREKIVYAQHLPGNVVEINLENAEKVDLIWAKEALCETDFLQPFERPAARKKEKAEEATFDGKSLQGMGGLFLISSATLVIYKPINRSESTATAQQQPITPLSPKMLDYTIGSIGIMVGVGLIYAGQKCLKKAEKLWQQHTKMVERCNKKTNALQDFANNRLNEIELAEQSNSPQPTL